jgi:hypothetical protein|tara:strand:- start:222 stop:602 length:381 start_codon:yes stop_codon:yes gene_type:complete
MKKTLLILLCFLLFFSSCVRTKCENCTKLFESEFKNFELDSIVQGIFNNSSAHSINYQNWNEFITTNFHNLNSTEEVCSKYGGMVSVDPLGDKHDFREFWYSHGSADILSANEDVFEIGYIYYDCK